VVNGYIFKWGIGVYFIVMVMKTTTITEHVFLVFCL